MSEQDEAIANAAVIEEMDAFQLREYALKLRTANGILREQLKLSPAEIAIISRSTEKLVRDNRKLEGLVAEKAREYNEAYAKLDKMFNELRAEHTEAVGRIVSAHTFEAKSIGEAKKKFLEAHEVSHAKGSGKYVFSIK